MGFLPRWSLRVFVFNVRRGASGSEVVVIKRGDVEQRVWCEAGRGLSEVTFWVHRTDLSIERLPPGDEPRRVPDLLYFAPCSHRQVPRWTGSCPAVVHPGAVSGASDRHLAPSAHAV